MPTISSTGTSNTSRRRMNPTTLQPSVSPTPLRPRASKTTSRWTTSGRRCGAASRGGADAARGGKLMARNAPLVPRREHARSHERHDPLADQLLFPRLQSIGSDVDPAVARRGDRDARVALPKRLAQLVAADTGHG